MYYLLRVFEKIMIKIHSEYTGLSQKQTKITWHERKRLML